MNEAAKRLRREYANIHKDPTPNIIARPNMSNILEWHYVIYDLKDPYEGGQYHGKVKFPPEYPHKPPAISMITPSGRFHVNTRLCLSMSDYHPETWNPLWSVSTILTGLISFMVSNEQSTGCIETTLAQKRQFAKNSKAWNAKNPLFKKHFPDLLQETNPSPTEQPLLQEQLQQIPEQPQLQQLQQPAGPRQGQGQGISQSDYSWVVMMFLVLVVGLYFVVTM